MNGTGANRLWRWLHVHSYTTLTRDPTCPIAHPLICDVTHSHILVFRGSIGDYIREKVAISKQRFAETGDTIRCVWWWWVRGCWEGAALAGCIGRLADAGWRR